MKLEKVLSLIPPELLETLAIETNVNYFAKKLQGEVMFKLLLHCIISHKDNSLRTMQSAYESIFFKLINAENNKGKIHYSSISERLSVIELSFFEKLFKHCVTSYKEHLGADGDSIIKFDSTIIALSSKLLNVGYQIKGGDAENYKQLKFTVGCAEIPEIVSFYTAQTNSSENVSLKATILEQSKAEKKRIKVFDRGITARATYDTFTDNDIQFVSRMSASAKHDIKHKNQCEQTLPIATNTVTIISDDWCQFYGENGYKSKHLVRRIVTKRIDTDETIIFITNNKELTAVEVTELYKRRWEIEVFFKFIKQLLNFKHLVSRSENGIQVVLYVTLSAAILLVAFAKENELTNLKIAKQQFANELETEIIKQIIKLCGGDPEKLNEILLYNTS